MNRKAEQLNKRAGFTIIELLTVMSIIIILISIMVPSLNRVKRYALQVKQKKNFTAIDAGLTMFNAEFDGYPESSQMDRPTGGVPYCGAMRLAEAMVGQDVLGFHPQSHFYQNGTTDGLAPGSPTSAVPPGNDLYPARRLVNPPPTPPSLPTVDIAGSERERKGLYLPRENANIYVMGDLFTDVSTIFGGNAYSLPVLCDVYANVPNIRTGRNVGTPILYYKASARNTSHPIKNSENLTNPQLNIYNYLDNYDLLSLQVPWMPGTYHPMGLAGRPTPLGATVNADPFVFYDAILNEKLSVPRPFNSDSYILISAGFDGLFGTKDDVFNFEN
jgi:type II secretory pathway pseudopilin PulG